MSVGANYLDPNMSWDQISSQGQKALNADFDKAKESIANGGSVDSAFQQFDADKAEYGLGSNNGMSESEAEVEDMDKNGKLDKYTGKDILETGREETTGQKKADDNVGTALQDGSSNIALDTNPSDETIAIKCELDKEVGNKSYGDIGVTAAALKHSTSNTDTDGGVDRLTSDTGSGNYGALSGDMQYIDTH